MLARDAQRLAEAARAGREQSDVIETSPAAHPVETLGRLQRPQQDRRRRDPDPRAGRDLRRSVASQQLERRLVEG